VLVSLLCFWLSPMIAEQYGTVRASVFFGTCLLVVALLLYVVYFFMDKKLDQQLEAAHAAVEKEEEEPFKFRDLGHVFGNSMFWIVAILCVLYYSAIFPFQKFATEMLVSNVGFEQDVAAKIFSLFPVGAMVITPILGFYLDARGKGATMLMIGAILMIVCHGTFAFFPFSSVSHGLATTIAIIAIVVLGISFSLVPAALWPSVPKIIPGKVLGSAYSAIFWIQNIGLMSVPMLIGAILDANNQNVAPGQPKDYFQAMLVFTAFGVVALITAILLKAADKKKGYGLELPNIKK
uniref:MFS transporter n=1 Tax=uncultured Porphyromonas sp. TaxID=159274 RepID=UPI00262B0CD9